MNIDVLGIPLDLGAGKRGVDMGPAALRNAKIIPELRSLGHFVIDHGDIQIDSAEKIIGKDKFDAKGFEFRDHILKTSRDIRNKIQSLPSDSVVLTLGGDHSMAMGTVAGNAFRGSDKGHRMGLIWIDAHTDFNTPQSSPSGNIHGMPVAHLCGLGDPDLANIGNGWNIKKEDIVMIAIRSVDEGEAKLVQEHGIKIYGMNDIENMGIKRIFDEAMERLSGTEKLHVSYDPDSLDPLLVPGTGTKVQGGLTYREGRQLMQLLSNINKVTSVDIVEVNPTLDIYNKTAILMTEMISFLFGRKYHD